MMPSPHPRNHAFGPKYGIKLAPWRAVYLSIPKVACTTLLTICKELLSIDGEVHLTARFPMIERLDIRRELPRYTVFAFVRDPWDRLLSCYLNKLDPAGRNNALWRNGVERCFWRYGDRFRCDMSFGAFVRAVAGIPDDEADAHFASQFAQLIDDRGDLIPCHLGRFETLEEDFRRIAGALELPPIDVPRLQPSRHGHYSLYYDGQARRHVESRYAEDIESFGYAFGGTAGVQRGSPGQ